MAIDQLGLRFSSGGQDLATAYRWPRWSHLTYTERAKPSHDLLRAVYRELAP